MSRAYSASRRRRISPYLKRLASIVILVVGFTAVVAPPASAHVITCTAWAGTPFKSGDGEYVFTAGGWYCSDLPDVIVGCASLYRRLYTTSPWTEVDWACSDAKQSHAITLGIPCSGSAYYRTRSYWSGFHGNWMDGEDTSPSTYIVC